VYGFLGVIDSFADYIMYWVPFFSPLKLVFLVWCWYPTTKGSNVIYYSFIQPLYKQHEGHIDSALNNMFDPKSVINAAKSGNTTSKKVSEEDLNEKKN
jgi:TB2/DP1, HVA22 family